MNEKYNFESCDLYIGLAGLDLPGTCFSFSRGIVIEPTFAHLMSPLTVAFSRPGPSGHHPAPWKAARGGFGQDITSQIVIPRKAGETFDERLQIAWIISFLLRLWSDPSITMVAGSNTSFSAIKEAPDAAAFIFPLQFQPRNFALVPADTSDIIKSIKWAVDNLETTIKLMRGSGEFRVAAHAMNAGQFIESSALALISLWGALETLFSPSTTELRFRISALIATYIAPAGQERADAQKHIAKLYDKRSAAAHGSPKHASDDLLGTFELLRKVLIKIIREGRIPSKFELEARLFGVTQH
jgi:hypothetical protein